MKKEITNFLSDIILKNYNVELEELELQNPPKKELGDYAFACFQLSKTLKKSPNLIAEELSLIISKEISGNEIIDTVNVSGPYLNIKINKLSIIDSFKKYKFGVFNENVYKGKTIVVDYIGANIGKPLHIGHMCTPNQGQAMINIYKKLSCYVISDSHMCDWGIILGKLITAFKLYGDKNKLEENAVEHLFELYVKISNEAEVNKDLEETFRSEFKKLSNGDPDYIKLWQNFTKGSIASVNKQLDRLNVKPDFDIGESYYEGLNFPKIQNYPDLKYSMKDIVSELIEKGIAVKNEDNSVGVIFSDESKIPSCILQKRDGTHGYLASDLASIKYRVENWSPDNIIYFVDVRQSLHFKQVFEIADRANWISKDKLFHAYNGFISLKDGAMSTRKGKIIKLDKLLDESELRAEKIILEKRSDIKGEELKNLSEIIGIGAIKYGYLKKSRETDVVFDWDEFMTFEGNSGPYIQYAYVRAIRLLEKSGISSEINFSDDYKDVKDHFKQQHLNLIKLLINYNSILFETAQKNMPHILAGYAYELTKSFNSFYNNVEVLKEKNEKIRNFSLILTKTFSQTIKDSFSLLGIEMPDKM
ncbi:arginine--tRNA ligase [Candidatus Gracilibacteria bacterium]|nr:MAG: arginine--tRNA ligase [Candidatus Gracilibacteria bacterium]